MISVIMPAYNSEKTIAEAVVSVFAQTYRDWELLVADDGSTDGTVEAVLNMAAKNGIPVREDLPDRGSSGTVDTPYVRILENETNRGVAASRNLAARAARGEWIAYLDSDDRWAAVKLEKQLLLFEKYPDASFLFTGSAFIEEDGTPRDYVLHVPEKISRSEILKQNLISCSSVLIRKDLMLRHPMPEEGGMHEDYVSWLGILREIPYAYGVDEPLLIYRISASSKSGNKLHAARLNWRALRRAGLSFPTAVSSMAIYALRSLRKWKNLR